MLQNEAENSIGYAIYKHHLGIESIILIKPLLVAMKLLLLLSYIKDTFKTFLMKTTIMNVAPFFMF